MAMRICGTALLVTALAIGIARAAAPQAVESDPAPNATVKAPLEMIHVLFHNPVDLKTAAMSVTGKDGKPIDVGKAMAMGTDGKLMMAMPSKPLPAGTYNVIWSVMGNDGKPLQGRFTFTAK
ncbi:MAG TPA: copper resistance CopC family protein [Micropepsaceae bacterium]|nr:copper resistance CopC family protein [Micropepsaceae bacterium]